MEAAWGLYWNWLWWLGVVLFQLDGQDIKQLAVMVREQSLTIVDILKTGTIPRACFPCLSSSKHHAVCMAHGCLDLTLTIVDILKTADADANQTPPRIVISGVRSTPHPALVRAPYVLYGFGI